MALITAAMTIFHSRLAVRSIQNSLSLPLLEQLEDAKHGKGDAYPRAAMGTMSRNSRSADIMLQ